MIARLRPEPIGCSDTSWRELVHVMNARPQRVVINKMMLKECVVCHQRLTGHMPELNPGNETDKYVVVDREALFGFVQEHGAICDRRD